MAQADPKLTIVVSIQPPAMSRMRHSYGCLGYCASTSQLIVVDGGSSLV